MVEKNFASRSSMQVAFTTRLLGMTITLFMLILTIKAELLDYNYVAWQLSLAIPILFAALISNSKIIDEGSFEKYKTFNLIVNSLAISLVANTIGLLISKYISLYIGLSYFSIFLVIYGYFFIKDFESKKFYNEMIILALIVLLGIIPALRPI